MLENSPRNYRVIVAKQTQKVTIMMFGKKSKDVTYATKTWLDKQTSNEN